MGSTLLVVGRLRGRKERDAAAAYLAGASDAALTSNARVALLKAWNVAPTKVACLDALNQASTCAFVEHAAALEGLKGFNEAMMVAAGGICRTGSTAIGCRCAATRRSSSGIRMGGLRSSGAPTGFLPILPTLLQPRRTVSAQCPRISS